MRGAEFDATNSIENLLYGISTHPQTSTRKIRWENRARIDFIVPFRPSFSQNACKLPTMKEIKNGLAMADRDTLFITHASWLGWAGRLAKLGETVKVSINFDHMCVMTLCHLRG